jgi:hypothetical protein
MEEKKHEDCITLINILLIEINAYKTNPFEEFIKIFHCYMLRSGGKPILPDSVSMINSSSNV